MPDIAKLKNLEILDLSSNHYYDGVLRGKIYTGFSKFW